MDASQDKNTYKFHKALRIQPKSGGLPSYADQADDLDSLKKTIEDGTKVSGGIWVTYLGVLYYIFITMGTINDVDLFLNRPIKIPVLHIEINILASIFLTPLILVIMHAYTLIHFALLADKAKRFNIELWTQISSNINSNAHIIRSKLRRQLPLNIFVQFLSGPEDVRSGMFGVVLKMIAWSTLVVAPILLLLSLSILFLPYHSLIIAWEYRLAIIIDLWLVWWLWRSILYSSGEDFKGISIYSMAKYLAAFSLSIIIVISSIFIIVFPGEVQEAMSFGKDIRNYIFNVRPDHQNNQYRIFSLSNTLNLSGIDITQFEITHNGRGGEGEERSNGGANVFKNFSGRDLSGAIFDESSFENVDFKSANLNGASFLKTKLKGSKFNYALLKGAKFDQSSLQGASFVYSYLSGSSFIGSQVQGATFENAVAENVNYTYAEMQGADFHNAHLKKSNFYGSLLQSSFFDYADLTDTFFENADAVGSSFLSSKLTNANFSFANISASVLSQKAFDAIRRQSALYSDVVISNNKDEITGNIEMYIKSKSSVVEKIICNGDDNAIYILRSMLKQARIFGQIEIDQPTVQFILSKNCPASILLSDYEKKLFRGLYGGANR